MLALAVFIYGVVRSNDARQIEQAGPNGLTAAPTAQVGVKGLPPLSIAEETESASGQEPINGQEPTQTSPLQIDAIAQQWLWRFEYPGGTPGHRTFTYGELVVPVDTPVVLNITSTDVLHSWWVPELGGQVQATPGETMQTWFKADEVGSYAGRSTIFCGTSFPAMRAWVRVVTVPEYTAYLEQLQKDLTAAQGIIVRGQKAPHAAPPEARPMAPRRARPPHPARDRDPRAAQPRQAWIERATSADHKTVGAAVHRHRAHLLALAATEFALMRLQLIVPENT